MAPVQVDLPAHQDLKLDPAGQQTKDAKVHHVQVVLQLTDAKVHSGHQVPDVLQVQSDSESSAYKEEVQLEGVMILPIVDLLVHR